MINTTSSIRLQSLSPVAVVIADGVPLPPATPPEARRFASPAALIAAGFAADSVLVAARNAIEAREWLVALRGHPRLGLRPLLLSASCGAHADALSDGLASTADDVLEGAAAVRARWERLERPEPADGDDQLLTFLYLRPDHALTPIADWRDVRVLYYPIADLFSREHEDGFALLSRLQQRGLLEPVGLVERLHVCPDCESAQLLFNEICPQCGGIDIADRTFLHCYTCGGVAPQDEYIGPDGLICPKCTARLRHIGVDYDRALETSACKSCGARFTEPGMKTRCGGCRKQFPPDALIERRFHSLRLSTAGETAARSGSVGDVLALIDEVSHAHPAYFAQTLNWLLVLGQRHREVHFSLIVLKFSNLQSLMETMPRSRVAQMLDALALRLRRLLRTSDLFMRDDGQLCWLLLPQTAAAGLEVLRARIAALSAGGTEDGGRSIEIAMATLTSADLGESAIDADMVMARMRGEFD